MAVLDMVGLAEFAKRPSTQLSGGQQQRLALARAFTREPRLLLLDEPLSNLDAQLREQMRIELKRLQKETGVTAIYVTHDQAEALAISDRIAVMNNGLIAQVGTPKEIYGRPASEFVANFIGRTNLLRGVLRQNADAEGVARVGTDLGELVCFFPTALKAGNTTALVVRPEHIAIRKSSDAAPVAQPRVNWLPGTVMRETYLGEIVEYPRRCRGRRDPGAKRGCGRRRERGRGLAHLPGRAHHRADGGLSRWVPKLAGRQLWSCVERVGSQWLFRDELLPCASLCH